MLRRAGPRRRDRLRRLQERARRRPERRRVLVRQGRRAAPRALPRRGGRRAPGSASTPSTPTPCCRARGSGTRAGARSAPRAYGIDARRARGALPPAHDAGRQHLARGHRPGRAPLRLAGALGQEHRQPAQRRRRGRGGVSAVAGADGMRASLFITCLDRHPLPRGRAGDRRAARAARRRGRLPGRADLLRPDARQHRLRARGDPARAALRARVRRLARSSSRRRRPASRMVRTFYPRVAELAGDAGARGRGRRAGAARARALRAARRPARRRGRRRVLPAPRRLPPELPRPAAARARRRAAAPAARRPRHRPRRAARGRPVLRLRRHVRDQERRHLDAMLADKVRAILDTGAEVCDRDRQLLPDAHRRRALAPADRRARRCTSPRSSPRPGRRGEPPPTSPSRSPRGGRSPTRSCAATSRARRARSATSAPPPSPRSPTGRSCARPGARSRTASCATSTSTWSRSSAASQEAGGVVHWARDAAEANAIVADLVGDAGRRRGRQGEVDDDRRDAASTTRSSAAASRSPRPTSPS